MLMLMLMIMYEDYRLHHAITRGRARYIADDESN